MNITRLNLKNHAIKACIPQKLDNMNSLNNSLRMNYKRGETDMTIKIYDTMTRSLRDFVPITENTVNMYVCGPTVYNYIHIGNARSAVAFDTIRRYFEYCGYTVNYISNFRM